MRNILPDILRRVQHSPAESLILHFQFLLGFFAGLSGIGIFGLSETKLGPPGSDTRKVDFLGIL